MRQFTDELLSGDDVKLLLRAGRRDVRARNGKSRLEGRGGTPLRADCQENRGDYRRLCLYRPL